MVRHLPNLLSVLRMLAAPLAAVLILRDDDSAALAVFVAAAFSDAADGFIARTWGVTSRFGARLDPAADKLLMLLCFVALLLVGVAPVWLVVIVIGRDLAIVLGWLTLRARGARTPEGPLKIGKVSTLVQVLYIGVLLVLLSFDLQAPPLELALALAAGLFTILSGLAYAQRLWRALPARAA